jgi:epoxyqueuosine reductase
VATPPHYAQLRQWLDAGSAAGMHWMVEQAEARGHPRHVLDGACSLLMLATNYRTAEPLPAAKGQGRVSRYAWGDDYHDVIHARLKALAAFHQRLTPAAAIRGVVDTAPLMERDFANLAGLGWIGKNTTLITAQFGSWVFLSALLTSEALEYDAPQVASRCGVCTACIEACPTGALTAPYQLDARRCISYWTIEHRGPMPDDRQAAIGDRVFGCDTCQDVCPWNRRVPSTTEKAFRPRQGLNPLALQEVLGMDEAAFRQRFCCSPLKRAKHEGILRNAAAVAENQAVLGD